MADVVVVGGGIGGLSAAVRLLQRGFRVTLVERQPRTGGYGISYRRSGYTFDLALHVVPCGGEGQEFYRMAELLGLEINFIRLQKGFNLYLGDYHFQMPNNYDELFDKLKDEFPPEAAGLERFRRDLEGCVHKYAPLFEYGTAKIPALPSFFVKLPQFLRHSSLSTDEWLSAYFTDERLKAILFQPAVFMGIGMGRFATVNFMMMFYLLLKKGMYTIAGGGAHLTGMLGERMNSMGGRLIVGNGVQKINCRGRKAISVTLDDDTTISCSAVIAANNLYDVVDKLIGRAYFSKSYLNNLEKVKPSVSVIVQNLGLDCPPKEAGIDSHISMLFPDSDIDGCFARQSSSTTIEAISVTAHGLSDSGWNNAVSLVAGTSPQWLHMDRATYMREKNKAGEAMLTTAVNRFPQLAQHIVVRDIATPKTMNRYTANPCGAIMGPACTAGIHRNLIKATKLPLNNVLMASAWTSRLGGFMQSMKSGILAAERL